MKIFISKVDDEYLFLDDVNLTVWSCPATKGHLAKALNEHYPAVELIGYAPPVLPIENGKLALGQTVWSSQ